MSIDLEPTQSIEMEFQDFLDFCREIIDMAMRKWLYPRSVFELSLKEQQEVVDRLNRHIDFELAKKPELKGLAFDMRGYGLMYVADGGNVMGAETVSDGDRIIGRLDTIGVLPVPTLESMQLGDETSIPIVDETLSIMLMLDGAVYMTGLNSTGEFEVEHDLSNYDIGIPLSHALRPTIVD